MATILDRLQALLDSDTGAKVREALKTRPDLIIDDAFAEQIIGVYDNGAPGDTVAAASGTTAADSTTAASATHTAALPSSASTTAAAQPVTTSAAASGNNDSILAAIVGLKSSIDETKATLKNVVTVDKIPKLGRQLRAQAIQDAHLTMKIENLHRSTFKDANGNPEELDLTKLGTFIDEQKKVGVSYPDVEKAYLAMVGDKLTDIQIAKKVDEQVRQKLSAATVPGQTTSVAMSPAQQVLAKERAKGTAADGDPLKKAIAALEQRDRANGAAQA